MRSDRFALCIATIALSVLLDRTPAAVQAPAAADRPAVVGLDHIPIAVGDLGAAAERYRALGFSLKPGRPHPNGIRNHHAKFPDGTELELITAPEARDALTTTYRRHLAAGDGPAFLALFAPDRSRVPRALDPSLDYLFFGPRNASPTDRPEHFAHPNTAESLISVWLSGDDLSAERALFSRVGATITRREVYVPERMIVDVARFHEGEALFLPASRHLVPGRRIVGATLRVRRLDAVRERLAARRIPAPAAGEAEASLFLSPAVTHGLWIELREVR
ncbi:MAG TPA: VOC family protein [Vicinamibacterales bacterium]|nr:VOC family protein [Vicinamibacterales bacterium]